MAKHPDYFVVMIDYGKHGRQAIVDPEMTWAGAIDAVREAMGDGYSVPFVHHFVDGRVEDRSEEAFLAVMDWLATKGEPLTFNEYSFIELHVSMQAAQCFRRVA